MKKDVEPFPVGKEIRFILGRTLYEGYIKSVGEDAVTCTVHNKHIKAAQKWEEIIVKKDLIKFSK